VYNGGEGMGVVEVKEWGVCRINVGLTPGAQMLTDSHQCETDNFRGVNVGGEKRGGGEKKN